MPAMRGIDGVGEIATGSRGFSDRCSRAMTRVIDGEWNLSHKWDSDQGSDTSEAKPQFFKVLNVGTEAPAPPRATLRTFEVIDTMSSAQSRRRQRVPCGELGIELYSKYPMKRANWAEARSRTYPDRRGPSR